jgi:hypothetical protein
MAAPDLNCKECGRILLPVNGQWMCCVTTCKKYAEPIEPSGTEGR